MASASEIVQVNKPVMHTFRFVESNQVVSLSEKQLEHTPYLAALVSNSQKMNCKRNEAGEYILSSEYQYCYFIPILSSVADQRSSVLFMNLPQSTDVLSTLDLYDYLCIVPFSIPSLTAKFDKTDSSKFRRHYYRATPSEARDTAVEFAVALAKQEYDLNDRKIVKSIFYLVVDILSSPSVFGPRLRYHTLMIVESCCPFIFTTHQRDLLCAYKRSLEILDDSSTDPDDRSETLDAPSNNILCWKKYLILSVDDDACSSASAAKEPARRRIHHQSRGRLIPFSWLDTLWPIDFEFSIARLLREKYIILQLIVQNERALFRLQLHKSKLYVEKKELEIRSARSGRFNTLPRRPTIDKFKHRSNTKAPKYR